MVRQIKKGGPDVPSGPLLLWGIELHSSIGINPSFGSGLLIEQKKEPASSPSFAAGSYYME